MGNKEYLTLEEMKEILLLKKYKIKRKKEEIINELKSMKIDKNKDIKEFNMKNTEIYNKLDEEFKLKIFPSDYLVTIINKASVLRIVRSETKDIIIMIAELYDQLEFELIIKTQNINNSSSNNRTNKIFNFKNLNSIIIIIIT